MDTLKTFFNSSARRRSGPTPTKRRRLFSPRSMRRASGSAARRHGHTRVYAEAFGKDPEFYGFVRSLESYEKFLGDRSTILLSPGSRLLRYLNDSNTGK